MYKFFQAIYYKYFDIRKKEYRSLLKYFTNRKKILDVGCGRGDFAILDPNRIIGIERKGKTAEQAKKRGCRVIKGNVLRLPFKNNSFDGIFCAHVIEHFSSLSALRLLREINRVLRKDGILLIQTPLMHVGFYTDFTHEKVYTPEAIMHYLSQTSQTSYRQIGSYKLLHLRYRYAELYTPLIEPARLPYGFRRSVLILWKITSLLLYFFGIKNYFCRNGYTLVLKKIS